MASLDQALLAWKNALGTENILTEASQLKITETATFATNQKIVALLSPCDVHEVQLCLKIASENNIPIYPISRGRNCGYGSKVPYENNSVLLDLGRLSNILDYDEELAFVRLQPGVTQQQLNHFLAEKGSKLWMDPVATFEDCSVIGNILERGHGMTSAADRVSSSCDYEVVLSDGRKIVTGYSSFPNAKIANLDRWAPGPQLDSLFTQSNLGVVTAMTVWLMPAPTYIKSIAFMISSNQKLENVIDQLRRLRLDGTLRFGPRFFNEYRLIQNFAKYPWDEMKGQTPLSSELAEKFQANLGIPLWTGIVGLQGSVAQVAASEDLVLQTLDGLVENIIFTDKEIIKNSKDEKKSAFVHFVHANFSGMTGMISPITSRPRWRKKSRSTSEAINRDWSHEQCGIIWCPVSSPFRGADTIQAVAIYRQILQDFGFEPDMSISCIRDRTLEINTSIIFDREDAAQEKAAPECARKLLEVLMKSGFYPHRLGLLTMDAIQNYPAEIKKTIRDLSQALDPQQILARGRYLLNSQ